MMANRTRLITVKNEFVADLISAHGLFHAVASLADKKKTYDAIQGWEPLHPAQARRVMALAFMNTVNAWENFVESTFIRYMAGARSPNGYQPTLRAGPCASLQHAGQLLKCSIGFSFESDYLSWSSWTAVTNRAKLFFAHGRPFSSIHDRDLTKLQLAVSIRNRVAHSSKKARADFVKVAKQYTGRTTLRQGYDVGNLLLEKPRTAKSAADSCFDDFFSVFVALADTIAP